MLTRSTPHVDTRVANQAYSDRHSARRVSAPRKELDFAIGVRSTRITAGRNADPSVDCVFCVGLDDMAPAREIGGPSDTIATRSPDQANSVVRSDLPHAGKESCVDITATVAH